MAVSAIMAAISTASAVMTAGSVATFSFLSMTGFSAVAASFLVTTAMGAALNALTPKPSFGQSRGFTLQGESGAALDHQIIYGEVRAGGARIYDASTGTDNEYLHRILAFAGHEINSYQQIWINDAYVSDLENTGTDGNGYVIYNVKEVTDPDGTTSNRYDDLIQIKQYLGTTNQPADANLITDTTGLTNGEWTSDHKLSGVAYLYVRFKYSADAFPNGVPAISAIIRGKKVYDTRTATTAWSDNPALCIRDYLTSDYGLSVPASRIDDTRVSTAANICEQSVESEERYTCNGAFVTSLTPGQILSDLLTSMGGLLWYAQGEWRMKAAAYTSPVLALDEDDLRSQISVSTRHSRRDGFNKVKGIFRGSETDWQQTDYPAVASIVSAGSFVVGQPYTITSVGTTNFTLIGASSNTVGVTFTATGAGTGTGKADYFLGLDNGLVNVLDYNLPFTASPKTAQRIARIALNRNREQLTVSASFGMRAFAVQVGDIITLTNTRFGWSNKEFEVLSWTFGLTEGLDIQVQMTLREIDSAVFTSVTGEVFSLNNTTLPNPYSAQVPSLDAAVATTFVNQDGTVVPQIKFSWSVVDLSQVDYFDFQWKLTTDSVYNSVNVKGTQFTLNPAQLVSNASANAAFDYRVRSVTYLGIKSAFASSVSPISTINDTTTPNAPSALTAVGGYSIINLSWTAPTQNTDSSALKDLFQYFIYRGTTTNPTTYIGSVSGEVYTDAGLADNTLYYYRVKAVDFSGNESAYSANASATTNQTLVDGDSVALVNIYRRSSTAPATPTGGSFDFTTKILTPPSGWSASVPSGTDPIYISIATASVTGTTGVDSSLTWATPQILAQNGTDGVVGSDGKSVYTAIVFRRSASVPATPSGGSFNFGTNVLTPPTNWFLDVPSGTDPIYGARYVFSIIGDTGTDSAGTWSTPFEIAENGVDGLDGADGADGLSTFAASVFKRSSTAPSTPTGGSYNFGTNTLTPPSTWSASVPSGTDPVYISTTLASVQGVTGTDSTLTWTTPVIFAQNGADGAAGATGARGAGRWYIGVASLPANSSAANTAFIAAIGTPVDRDQAWFYTGTLSSPTAQSVWIYNAGTTTWTEQAEVIDGDLLVDGTVTATKLDVSQLSAITATIGTLQSAASPNARLVISTDKIEVYDSSNVLRVKIGNLA